MQTFTLRLANYTLHTEDSLILFFRHYIWREDLPQSFAMIFLAMILPFVKFPRFLFGNPVVVLAFILFKESKETPHFKIKLYWILISQDPSKCVRILRSIENNVELTPSLLKKNVGFVHTLSRVSSTSHFLYRSFH